jgi:hypothetical protein
MSDTQDINTKAVSPNAWLDDALNVARKIMYQRTIGLTLDQSDNMRTWVDATLAEVKRAASSN